MADDDAPAAAQYERVTVGRGKVKSYNKNFVEIHFRRV